MPTVSPTLTVMLAAAHKAARGLLRDFGEVENLQVSLKGPADFVSQADLQAEKVLKAELRRARPTFGFLTEEAGAEAGRDAEARWIVDPLDGTTNFLHAIPQFAISIGLERAGDLVAGVVHAPITGETFYAEKNTGAFLMTDRATRRLRVSARKRLADAVIATGVPHRGRGDHDAYLRQLRTVMAEAAGIRRFGAASLDLAFVAAGRCDGFWESDLQPWDMAAGIVLVREAGGQVLDRDGGTDMLVRGDIVAGTQVITRTLQRRVADPAPAHEQPVDPS